MGVFVSSKTGLIATHDAVIVYLISAIMNRVIKGLYCIFLPKFLAKGIFFTKTLKNWHFRAKLASVFGKFLLKREYLGWNSLKSCKNGLMIRKSSLAKGMFSTKISLTKGIRSKTGAAHPRQNFFGVPPPPPPRGDFLSQRISWMYAEFCCKPKHCWLNTLRLE